MKMIYSGNDRAHASAGLTLIEVMIAIVYFHDNRKYGTSVGAAGLPVACWMLRGRAAC